MHSVCDLLQRLNTVLQTFCTCGRHTGSTQLQYLRVSVLWHQLRILPTTTAGTSSTYSESQWLNNCCDALHTHWSALHSTMYCPCVCVTWKWDGHHRTGVLISGHAQCRFRCYNKVGISASYATSKLCKHHNACMAMSCALMSKSWSTACGPHLQNAMSSVVFINTPDWLKDYIKRELCNTWAYRTTQHNRVHCMLAANHLYTSCCSNVVMHGWSQRTWNVCHCLGKKYCIKDCGNKSIGYID